MGRRSLALTAIGLFLFLAIVVAGLTHRSSTDPAVPTPPSTFLPSPDGASAIAEAATRAGIKVERWRSSYRRLQIRDTIRPAPLFVVLGPSMPLSRQESLQLVRRARSVGPVLLVGPTANTASECFGWSADWRGADSIRVRVPGEPVSPQSGWVRAAFHRAIVDTDRTPSFEQRASGVGLEPCRPRVERVDTLLETAGRRPVLLRLTMQKGFPVYLLSDPSLLSNRVVRASDAGPYFLHLFQLTPGGVLFDEVHHGFDEGGSTLSAVLGWGARSPWGWAAWQMVIVGCIALLVAMGRTGPVLGVIRRARRSPLEHVRALATALRAARGHDVAVDLLVRGLRRRLSRDGKATRGSPSQWLQQLQERVRTPRARAAVARLDALTRPGRSAQDVLAAANAVEDVWQELRP